MNPIIKMNPTAKTVIGLTLIAAVGGLQALMKVEPNWAWIGLLVQVLIGAELAFTVPQKAADLLAKAGIPLAILVFSMTGCANAATGVKDAVIVLNDAICLISTYDADVSATPPLATDAAILDAGQKCGVIPSVAIPLLTAHQAGLEALRAGKMSSPQH